MLRWLGRLLLIGLILAAIGFAASRLLGQDDDFDDFDDIEEGFDYQETPLEIAVPAGDSGGSGASPGGTGAATNGTSAATSPGLQDIKGIGPAYEQRLQAIGINSVSELVNADAGSLSQQLDVPGGRETIEDWLSQARNLVSGGSSQDGSQGGSQGGTND